MKVKNSSFLADSKPLLKELLDALLARYEFASILATDSVSKNYNVSKMGTNISEDSVLSERGFCVKIYDKGQACEYSFSSISREAIPALVQEIADRLIPLGTSIPAEVTPFAFDSVNEEKTVFNESTEYEQDPEDMGDEAIIDLLTRISEKGRAYDERILDCRVAFSYQKYSKLFLSNNKDMTQNVMWSTGYVIVMASEGEEIKDSYKPVSMLGGSEVLKTLENNLDGCCKTAIELLSAEPIIPGEYECVCEPDVTGMIVHEAFGHGVEMDMFVKDRALAQEFIGKPVASELITMHDGAKTIKEVASFFFDDEGVLAHDTVIIDKGVLKTGICDSQAAMHLGKAPTGNGRRESTQRKAYTRMTNTIFEPGHSTVEEMIASVKDGFLLCAASSGMEDPKNWGIQLMVQIAREIKDGKLTGRIFSPIVMTGYVPDLLKSISMISDSMQAGGAGYCGKGYKEWVKVSDGGPYIKAKIRLG
ncbi:MAG: TldD/PmbA family protein [Lachnospiraceae bacterium]|nr:TldD/PmbA family protein [Lachnospiraceae bacterium]